MSRVIGSKSCAYKLQYLQHYTLRISFPFQILVLIVKIKSKHLGLFWKKRDPSHINPDWKRRLQRILNALELAQSPKDLDLPGFRLHRLKGNQKNVYSIRVTGNWRVVFRFIGTNVTDVDLVDYHWILSK